MLIEEKRPELPLEIMEYIAYYSPDQSFKNLVLASKGYYNFFIPEMKSRWLVPLQYIRIVNMGYSRMNFGYPTSIINISGNIATAACLKQGFIVAKDLNTDKVSTVFMGDANVLCVAVSGNTLVSGHRDSTIKIWDIKTGKCLNALLLDDKIDYLALSEDGQIVVIYTEDCVFVWNYLISKSHFLKWNANIHNIAISTTDNRSCDSKATVLVCEANAIKILEYRTDDSTLIKDAGNVSCMAVIDSKIYGKIILAGYGDGIIQVWDIKTSKCLKAFKATNGIVTYVGMSDDGTQILSGDNNGIIKIWEPVFWKIGIDNDKE